VRHTRAVAWDRTQQTIGRGSPDEQVSARLTELIHPLTLSQAAHYHRLGLRERVLTLPVMVLLVLSMIWRQIGSACAMVCLLHDEGFLWTSPTPASQQALSQHLRVFPAERFARARGPAAAAAGALGRYAAVLAVDGSTLDVLLRDREATPLAGRMTGLLDVGSRPPRAVWYEPDSQAHDQRC